MLNDGHEGGTKFVTRRGEVPKINATKKQKKFTEFPSTYFKIVYLTFTAICLPSTLHAPTDGKQMATRSKRALHYLSCTFWCVFYNCKQN